MVGSNDIERSRLFYNAVLGLLGMDEPALQGQPWHNLLRLLDEASGEPRGEWLEQARLSGKPQRVRGELRIAPVHARAFVAELNAVPLHNPGDVVVLLVLRDISEEIDKERQIVFQAFHDPLTGLGNRSKLARDLPQDLARSRATQGRLALLFIDLDNFKDINDTLGHEAGDDVLNTMGQRMSALVREVDTVARIGGDEFIILLDGADNQTEITQIAQRMVDTLQRPVIYRGQQLACGASIGIGCFPQDGEDITSLIAAADQAMYVAKQSGRSQLRFASALADSSQVRSDP